MKISQKHHLPPDSVITEASPLLQRGGTPGLDAVRIGHFKTAESLRRRAYLRLARAITGAGFGRYRSALKH